MGVLAANFSASFALFAVLLLVNGQCSHGQLGMLDIFFDMDDSVFAPPQSSAGEGEGGKKLVIDRSIFAYNNSAYSDWSEWSACKPTDRCQRVRFRTCLDDSWQKSIKDYRNSEACVVKFIAEREQCTEQALTDCQEELKKMMQKVDDLANDCGVRDEATTEKIIGGRTARSGSWPWHAGLYIDSKTDMPACGATMITPKHALTAAHCLTHEFISDQFETNAWLEPQIGLSLKVNDHNLKKEDKDEVKVEVEQFIIHPKYHKTRLGHSVDLAILRLQESVSGESFRYACLPKANDTISTNATCVAVGWGYTGPQRNRPSAGMGGDDMEEIDVDRLLMQFFDSISMRRPSRPSRWRPGRPGGSRKEPQRPNELQEVELPILPIRSCTRQFGRLDGNIHICAGKTGKDTCQSDSGGGLFCKNERDNTWSHYGVTSFGAAKGCGKLPGVYTSVSNAVDWIRKILRDEDW